MPKELKYWTLKITNLPARDEDRLSSWFFEQGAAGIHQDLAFSQEDKRFLPKAVEQDSIAVNVYFESCPEQTILEDFHHAFVGASAHVQEDEVVDWHKQWKDQWQPFRLSENFWVVPTWMRASFHLEGVDRIFIDPGMAFGTGTHATTQLATAALEKLVQGQTQVRRAVDVGTGSGILAIVLEKLGVSHISGFDTDEEAERVYRENTSENQMEKCVWREQWADEGPYDLLVANIIDGVLLDLKAAFQKSVRKGSLIVFSGILAERGEGFLQEMTEEWPLELIDRGVQDEWLSFSFRVL